MFSLINARHLARFASSSNIIQWAMANASTNCNDFLYEPKFSNVEQEKILNILNTSNSSELLSLNIAQGRIKSLENYKKRKGPFKSLEEILEVDGLSIKSLEKLCQQIIADNPTQSVKPSNENKRVRQMASPQISNEIANAVSSFVGIHIASTGVSWAKIIKDGNVLESESWSYRDFGNLPKKLCPTETCQLALQILRKIPFADVYVFEGTNNMNLQSQKQSSLLASNMLQFELSSMLLTLLNTSRDHNKNYTDDPDYDAFINCVYFLKPKLSARLFKTLVGNECVASIGTVTQLLGNAEATSELPCSPIDLDDQSLKQNYLTQTPAHKELLGQALMLTIAFGDLCIKRNPVSITAVTPGKR